VLGLPDPVPQPPCALWVPATRRHLPSWRSSTMDNDIACICLRGTRNAMPACQQEPFAACRDSLICNFLPGADALGYCLIAPSGLSKLSFATETRLGLVILLLLILVYLIRETHFVFALALLFAYLLRPLVYYLDCRLPGRSRASALALVSTFDQTHEPY
jgi:hypothetical protein